MRIPDFLLAPGAIDELPARTIPHGRRILLITGARTLERERLGERLAGGFGQQGIEHEHLTVTGEPSPDWVDETVRKYHPAGIEAVVAVGGGSPLDAAKAVAGLLPSGRSVMDHLEGVGRGVPYHGPALPFLAAPTTAGTGSEATRNAVLSRVGPGGFKKSFRAEALVPRLALLDPELLVSCPPDQRAANGMDAFTQLLESLVSQRANPLTQALAREGIRSFATALPWVKGETLREEASVHARAQALFAAFLSGVCLAETGLGSVHGLASPLGAHYPIPHGAVCGTLVAEATALNLAKLRQIQPDHPALAQYAWAGATLAGRDERAARDHPEREADHLVDRLRAWTEELALPRLSAFGVTPDALPSLATGATGASGKTNPAPLSSDDLAHLLASRL
jgi:alcohol dehydrogenase